MCFRDGRERVSNALWLLLQDFGPHLGGQGVDHEGTGEGVDYSHFLIVDKLLGVSLGVPGGPNWGWDHCVRDCHPESFEVGINPDCDSFEIDRHVSLGLHGEHQVHAGPAGGTFVEFPLQGLLQPCPSLLKSFIHSGFTPGFDDVRRGPKKGIFGIAVGFSFGPS